MATEEGIVTRTAPNRAWIKTQRSSACESCPSHDACNSMGGGNEMEVQTLNDVGAVTGDRVHFSFDTGKLMGISFFLYIFPILVLIAGAILGQHFAPRLDMNESVASALGGFAFFGLAFIVIRWGSSKFAANQEYQPRIIKVFSKE